MGDIKILDQWSRVGPTEIYDVYHGLGVGIYDSLSQAYDLTTPVVLAAERPGPILELCCGAGRVGLTLLAMGSDYHGIDLSSEMIQQFRDHATDQGLDVVGRLAVGDASELGALDFSLPGSARSGPIGHFDSVLVPAFSLVLFEKALRRRLFQMTREVLSTTGVFTAEVYTANYYARTFNGRKSMCSWSPRDHGGYLVSFAELTDDREEVRFIEQRPELPPVVLHTWKYVYSSDDLVADLAAAGFRVTDRRPSTCPLAEWVSAEPI